MCGIAAIFSPDARVDLRDRAQRTLDLIRHRGPDDSGVEAFAAGRVTAPGQSASIALAANRLAIQDLTSAGHQPMSDRSGRYWLVFNGEIYNFPELRETLALDHESLRSRGDTEVLLRLLVAHGTDALPMLDGMFAFVFLDLETGRVLAARDRFGIKPLYAVRSPDGTLTLASEIKGPLTAAPGWRAEANLPRVRDYLARGLIDHTHETLFRGVRPLPAGHVVSFDAAAPPFPLPSRPWFELTPAPDWASAGDPAAHLRVLLARAVARRQRADVTVGSCLSGGLDSSSIVCLAGRARSDVRDAAVEQLTFTARSENADLDEWRFAETAARAAHARAIEVRPDADAFLDAIDDLVWTQDEPFAGPSVFAQHAVFGAAREHGVTVMLDGQGADEQLAGYHAFFRVRLLELLRAGRFVAGRGRCVRGIASTACRVFASSPKPRRRGCRPVSRSASSNALVDEIVDGEHLAPSWRDPFHAMEGRRRGVREFSIDQLAAGSLPMLLHWEDRSSMAHSVEARVPFLCPEVVRFVLALPSARKIDDAMTKIVLREAMRGVVPEAILARTDKIAFATDDRRWFGVEHRDKLRPLLAAAYDACGDLLRPGGRRTLEAMVDGERAYDPILWRVICLGAWVRRFGIGDMPHFGPGPK